MAGTEFGIVVVFGMKWRFKVYLYGMKTKLFENKGGNRFKLLTESMNPDRAKSVRDGLKKVFANAGKELPYDKVQNFGLGFIKDVSEARKCALQEARDIAPGLGFADHPETGTFVKENDFSKLSAENPEDALAKIGSNEGGDETDMSNPAENREVQIAKEILNQIRMMSPPGNVAIIRKLANELIKMHGQK